MIWFYVLTAVAVGTLLPIQAGINSRLRSYAGGMIPATLVSVAVSGLVMLAVVLATRAAFPTPAKAAGSPWWVWTGGVLGVAIVLATLGLVSRLGAAFLFALLVVGQMVASLTIDHHGLLGVPQQEITPLRLLGVIFLIAGVVLIRFF